MMPGHAGRRVRLMAMLGSLGVWGCGGKPSEPAPAISPEAVLHDAMEQYRRGDCGHAREGFQQVQNGTPGRDSLVALARYYEAECGFADGLFLEASRQFRRVSDEYATFRLAPDALLRAGDSQAELWQDPELDPEFGEAALTTYRELLARFPGTPAAERAKIKLARLAAQFADKEYRNGLFYLRLKAYDSAILYFRGVVADYAQSRFAPLALMKLVQVYGILRYTEERKEACEHLGRYYPQTPGLSEACPAAADSSGTR